MKRVYLDHNATTPLRDEAREAWLEAAGDAGNASSLHASGRRARDRVDRAREEVASALGVAEDEVLFTSGGTESDNFAVLGALGAAPERRALLTSPLEHSAVLGPARALAERGHAVHEVGVDARGGLDLEGLSALAAEVRPGLVSLAAANNEIGCLAPLEEVRRRLDALPERPRLHTDAVQALGKIPVRLDAWGVDLASFSAHKVGGPLGVGILVRRRGVPLGPLLFGGGQEGELRPGTENVPGIAAAAVAVRLAVEEQEAYRERTSSLVRLFWSELASRLPAARLQGPSLDEPRLPNTLNVSVPGTDGKVLVTRLDLRGLSVSAGSACASGSLEASHVLVALGCDEDTARAGLRISFGRDDTERDARRAVEILTDELAPSRAT